MRDKVNFIRRISLFLCALTALIVLSSCSEAVTDEAEKLRDGLVSLYDVQPPVPSETTADETVKAADEEADKSKKTAETAETASAASAYTESVSSETEAGAEKAASVEKDGSYTSPEDVAEYIHTFGTLPPNFITKKEAQALGWDSGKGNLWEVAEGKSIGGDRFGNYEGLLPEKKGRKYTECDVNYSGGYRGSERIIFSNDGLIFYTDDHYKSFTQLY